LDSCSARICAFHLAQKAFLSGIEIYDHVAVGNGKRR
jgi:hypothetical protein